MWFLTFSQCFLILHHTFIKAKISEQVSYMLPSR